MAKFPALPIWTDALLGDTQHLSQAEFGAYMLMLIVAWRTPTCSLPNDDKYLARITRSDRNWGRIKSTILSFWTIGEDGQLRQKRLSYEHLVAAEKSAQKSEAGKTSARKRKEKLLTAVDAILHGRSNESATPNLSTISSTESSPCSDSVHASNHLFEQENSADARKRATRLAADWYPDSECRQFAENLGLDVDAVLPQFQDYWLAKPRDATKLDWNATWRSWCRREAQRADRGPGGRGGMAHGQGAPSSVAAARRAAARFKIEQ